VTTRICKRLREWFMYSWSGAWILHVWGFHEAKFDSEDVKEVLPVVERMVLEAQKTVEEGAGSCPPMA
jgi:hypothetical protein